MYTYKKRRFLNTDPTKHARIIATVERQEKWSSVEFQLADCRHTIYLEFDIDSNEKDLKSTEKKLGILVDTVNEWAEKVREEIAHLRAKNAEKPSKKLKSKAPVNEYQPY